MPFNIIFLSLLLFINFELYPQEIKEIIIVTNPEADEQLSKSFQELIQEMSEIQDSIYVLKNLPNTLCIPGYKKYTFIGVRNNNKVDNILYEFNKFTIKKRIDNSNDIEKLYDAYSDLSFNFFRKGIKIQDFNDELPKEQNGYKFFNIEYISTKHFKEIKELLQSD